MKRVYKWQLIRRPKSRGLNHLAGTFEAHSVKEARDQVDEVVAEYSGSGLLKGEFTLIMRTNNQVFKDRVVKVASRFADDAVPIVDGPTGNTLCELLDS